MRRTPGKNTMKQAAFKSAAIAVCSLAALSAFGPAAVLADTAAAGTGSVIIKNVEGNETRFFACQLFRATTNGDGTASSFQWVSEAEKNVVLGLINDAKYGAGLTQAQSGDVLKDRAQKAAEWISAYVGENGTDPARRVGAEEFLHELSEVLIGTSVRPADVNRQTLAAGTAKELDAGYWMILTDPDSIDQPGETGTSPIFTLTQITEGQTVEIVEKTGIPTLKKEVRNDSSDAWTLAADSQFGQNLDYRLTGTVSENYVSFHEYSYRFNDTFDEGLDYVDTSAVVSIDGQDVTDSFTISWANHKLTVECKNLKNITKTGSSKALVNKDSVITVEYQAKLNKNAVTGAEGNDNHVTVTYSSDPQHSTTGDMLTNDTPESTTADYTFQLHIKKTDKETNESLEGAKFIIRQSNGDEGTAYYLKKDTDSDFYSLVKNEADATVFSTKADGSVDLKGLDVGRYTIIEKEAPEGYKFINRETSFSISAAYDGTNLTEFSAEGIYDNPDAALGLDNTDDNQVNAPENSRVDAASGTVNVTIGNTEKVRMPVSGQGGIALIAALGMGITGISVAALLRKKQDQEESDRM